MLDTYIIEALKEEERRRKAAEEASRRIYQETPSSHSEVVPKNTSKDSSTESSKRGITHIPLREEENSAA